MRKDSDLPVNIPLMPLREIVIFPHTVTPLFVGREASIKAIEEAQSSSAKEIFLVVQRNSKVELPDESDLYKIGVVCRLLQVLRLPDGTIKILVEGLYRAKWTSIDAGGAFLTAQVKPESEFLGRPQEKEAMMKLLKGAFEEYAQNTQRLSQDAILSILALHEPGELADSIISHLKVDFQQKQKFVELADISERIEEAYDLIYGEIDLSSVEKRIKQRIKTQMEKNQREYYLTEKIKAINKEMGREDETGNEISELEEKVKKCNLPEYVHQKTLHEIKKLRALQPAVAEYAVARNYIDNILDLPWNTLKEISIDIKEAKKILNAEHYGLEKIKERILEYLAVQQLSKGLKTPILCFVGPPGVGKTSLAKSVAKATGRDFARLSLGGVKDEAEIRGHRRTYVGAMPGKILQTLKRVHSNNPLFLLDEIDKISSDYRGDPASALLEVLDREQNSTFMDHYLDMEYDLSKIFFITTANSLQAIPEPLADRMEIVEIPSYLDTEKIHIAKNFLLPRQCLEHGLDKNLVHISDKAINSVITSYTSEAGVRDLERILASICRKIAVRRVESGNLASSFNVTCQNLQSYLGAKKFLHDEREQTSLVGVATGLAYSPRGGDILHIETCVMGGTGQISSTGSLGKVMTESIQTALAYVRSKAVLLGLEDRFYRKTDVHVHVPGGAIPKDGPSAGIALVTSIISALTGIPVRNDIAMTGEISLRGRVLPIGGLREKLLAAKRAGITSVIIPAANKKDLSEVPGEILKDLKLLFVTNIDEVLPLALNAPENEIFRNKAASGINYNALPTHKSRNEYPDQ